MRTGSLTPPALMTRSSTLLTGSRVPFGANSAPMASRACCTVIILNGGAPEAAAWSRNALACGSRGIVSSFWCVQSRGGWYSKLRGNSKTYSGNILPRFASPPCQKGDGGIGERVLIPQRSQLLIAHAEMMADLVDHNTPHQFLNFSWTQTGTDNGLVVNFDFIRKVRQRRKRGPPRAGNAAVESKEIMRIRAPCFCQHFWRGTVLNGNGNIR